MAVEKVSVLVVGAGPTGLMAACQLALHKISFRVIDKNTAPTSQSRALVLHARTLEIFQQMGIADKALALGEPCHGVTWMFNGREAATMKIEGDDLTPFPYVLCLEQSKTEELLMEFLKNLGHVVERGLELVDCVASDKNVKAMVKKVDGTEETIEADYLIGADGAHSIVREKMGLHLDGETYPQTLAVIDCQVQANFRPHEIYVMATEKGLTGFFPMVQSHDKTSNTRYRVLIVLPHDCDESLMTFDAIQKDFADRMQMSAKIYDPAWISIYHTHHRHVKAFRKGRCFVAGDAAHIHSPVGGQGMNTGLQDVYNLVWKLALVIKEKAKVSLLDTYHDERILVAENLVKTTDKMFYMAAGEQPLVKTFRLKVLPGIMRIFNILLQHVKAIAKANFRIISQIGIHYRQSLLSQNASAGNFSKNVPQPGDRLPCVFFQENGRKINIQDYLKDPSFHLLVFSKNAANVDLTRFQSLCNMHFIAHTSDAESVYKAFGIEHEGYYLVRPDMYIACRSATLNFSLLEAYLNQKIFSN